MTIDSATVIASAIDNKNSENSKSITSNNSDKAFDSVNDYYAINSLGKKPTRKSASKVGKSTKEKCRKLHKPLVESTKTITNRLYKDWSQVVHSLYSNRCAVCGCEGKNDAHHIQPRQICSGLRFDPMNGICLCPSHHKWGKQSAHKGMLWFVTWLQNNKKDVYDYVMANMDKELDCKNRSDLYFEENLLHRNYEHVLGKLPTFSVVGYTKDGTKVHSDITAYNKKSAEYIFWNSWLDKEHPLKGIHKTEQIATTATI